MALSEYVREFHTLILEGWITVKQEAKILAVAFYKTGSKFKIVATWSKKFHILPNLLSWLGLGEKIKLSLA